MDVIRVAYWALASLLIGFGLVSIPTIGMPFLVTGLVLAALAPLRSRPAVRWPWLVATTTFFLAYVLVAPLTCASQETVLTPRDGAASGGDVHGGDVACTSLLGINYTGGPGYDPPLWPAALTAAVAASGAGLGTRAALVRRGPHGSSRRSVRQSR